MEQKFNFSKPQIIVISVIGLIAFIFLGIFTGILPGGKEKRVAPPQMDLMIWGVVDESSAFEASLMAYSKLQPNINVTYKKISEASYEHELINALAADKGPDIFMIDNSWLPKHFDKMAPMPIEKLSINKLKSLFRAPRSRKLRKEVTC